jgi:hypothetical protein
LSKGDTESKEKGGEGRKTGSVSDPTKILKNLDKMTNNGKVCRSQISKTWTHSIGANMPISKELREVPGSLRGIYEIFWP